MTTAVVTGTAVEAIPTGTYRLDAERSNVSFTTRHLFGLASVQGALGVADGQLVMAAPTSDSTVTVRAMAASFSTGNPKRDEHVKSPDFLDAGKNPAIEFTATKLHQRGQAYLAAGTLTVAGVAAPLELTITGLRLQGDTLTVTATGSVDRYAHGLGKMRGIAGRRLALDITATFVKVSA